MSTPEMDAWVSRMLGVAMSGGLAGRAPPPPLKLRTSRPPVPAIRHVSVDGRARWTAARDQVGAQVSRLMSKLAGSGDPDIQRVSELGLAALTQGLNTSLVASLIDVDAAAPDQADAARSRARTAVADMKAFVGSDPLIALMDGNPAGVPVSIRATLGDALQQIEKALA